MKADVGPAVGVGGCPSVAGCKRNKTEGGKPERLTNLRGKWDGNGKRDRDWKGGEGWKRLEKGGDGEGLSWGWGERRGRRNETKFSLAISVFLLQVLGPFH